MDLLVRGDFTLFDFLFYTYFCVCISACIYICTYICVYIYMYIYLCIQCNIHMGIFLVQSRLTSSPVLSKVFVQKQLSDTVIKELLLISFSVPCPSMSASKNITASALERQAFVKTQAQDSEAPVPLLRGKQRRIKPRNPDGF